MHKNSAKRHSQPDSPDFPALDPNLAADSHADFNAVSNNDAIWDAFLPDDDPEPLPELHDFWIDGDV